MISLAAAVAAAALAAQDFSAPLSADPIAIRFCPGDSVRIHPQNDRARIQSLLVHNVAVINTGPTEIRLTGVDLELLRTSAALDIRRFEGAELDAAAQGGARLKAAGLMDIFPGHFCDGEMLSEGVSLSDDALLSPGEAVLINRQFFAWRGARDTVRASVRAEGPNGRIEATAMVPIEAGASRTSLRFPLRGRWYAAVGATPHGGHRWLMFEEFALDIAALGPDSRSHRGAGTRFSDYLAYGADVLAAADGVVVAARDGQPEDPAAMRRPDETLEAYADRGREIQAALIAAGNEAVAGNYVVIDHGRGEHTQYLHLRPGTVKVRAGQRVAAGTVLGEIGSSGSSTEPHLHFNVCDGPALLACKSIPPSFVGIELPFADEPRAIQAGDIVVAP